MKWGSTRTILAVAAKSTIKITLPLLPGHALPLSFSKDYWKTIAAASNGKTSSFSLRQFATVAALSANSNSKANRQKQRLRQTMSNDAGKKLLAGCKNKNKMREGWRVEEKVRGLPPTETKTKQKREKLWIGTHFHWWGGWFLQVVVAVRQVLLCLAIIPLPGDGKPSER